MPSELQANLHRDPLAIPRVLELLDNLRAQLARRGGPSCLARAFRLADRNHDGGLDADELEMLLNRVQVFCSKNEVSMLLRAFDADGSGTVDFDEFRRALAPPLSGRRRAVVESAWRVLDRDGSGEATVADLRGRFDVSVHPRVVAGELTQDEALELFLQQFDGERGSCDGVVTWAEFLHYYTNISATVVDDPQFVQVVENAWCVSASNVDSERLEQLETLLRDKMAEKSGSTGDDASCRLRMRKLFAFFDKSGDGNVTIDEFLQVARRLGVALERSHAQSFFNRYDVDGSGTLSYREFTTQLYAQ